MFPIVWSICHLSMTTGVEGKGQMALKKLSEWLEKFKIVRGNLDSFQGQCMFLHHYLPNFRLNLPSRLLFIKMRRLLVLEFVIQIRYLLSNHLIPGYCEYLISIHNRYETLSNRFFQIVSKILHMDYRVHLPHENRWIVTRKFLKCRGNAF